jgi:hypothetical protein
MVSVRFAVCANANGKQQPLSSIHTKRLRRRIPFSPVVQADSLMLQVAKESSKSLELPHIYA